MSFAVLIKLLIISLYCASVGIPVAIAVSNGIHPFLVASAISNGIHPVRNLTFDNIALFNVSKTELIIGTSSRCKISNGIHLVFVLTLKH